MKAKLGKYYENATPEQVEPFFSDIIAFVALCERMENKTGKPVNILAAI
jgi:ABC-type transporter MlaC component